MRPRRPARPDPRLVARERVKELVEMGLPAALSSAVAQGRVSLNDALERMARRTEVESLMRRHGLTRAIATQVVLGHADLAAYLGKRRMEDYRAAQQSRSCLEEAAAHGRTLALLLHGQRRVEGRIVAADAYNVTVHEPGAAEPTPVHKLQIKAAYLPEDFKKLRKVLRRDKTLSEAPRPPVDRPQDRYTLSDRRLWKYLDEGTTLDVTLLEGEILRGAVLWFSRYEFAIGLKGEASVTLFRHALADVRPAT